MIRRILISENDKKNLSCHEYPKDPTIEKMDYSGLVVNKPWGYEYLMFYNPDISIWMLYIKKGHSTSKHCHPKKRTSLLLISGEAKCSTLDQEFIIRSKEGCIYEKGVFHKTEAISEEGIFVMEIETPSDKADLFRLNDEYKRVMKAYTDKKNITDKIYNYNYLFVKDKKNSNNIFGKYKFQIRNFKKKDNLEKYLGKNQKDIGIILSGEITTRNEHYTLGDMFYFQDLKINQCNKDTRLFIIKERENPIKVSDYIIDHLKSNDENRAFLVNGGKIMYLLEGIRKKGMKHVCNSNENASAMAAHAYSKLTGKPGILILTGGDGTTNAITGVAGAWIDSNPLIVISGQSNTEQTIGKTGLRQLGVNEINIIDIVRPITKYAVMIKDHRKIKYYLEKAMHIATSGRPGPVWLDIPINLQIELISENELENYYPVNKEYNDVKLEEKVTNTLNLIKNSKRPIILLGNGVRLSKAENEFLVLAERLGIPILTSRNANDLMWEEHPLYCGRPGSFGQRHANFAIQNCDLLLSIGSRVSLGVTGWAYQDFARGAKKVFVDIDYLELNKPTVKPDISINTDCKKFIEEMLRQTKDFKNNIDEWKNKIMHWKKKYPVVLPNNSLQKDYVNTYYFTEILSMELNNKDIIVTDMGMSFQSIMQAFKIKKGQRLLSSSGIGAVGFGIPGSIGACIGNSVNRVICVCGDESFQRSISELQTIRRYKLPIKIFIFNNHGQGSMRQIQKTHFKDSQINNLSNKDYLPDLEKIAKAYEIEYCKIENQNKMREGIKKVLDMPGAVICEVNVSEEQLIIPKQGTFNRPDGKYVPRPIEDMFPYLDREELEKEMIIEPVPFDPYKD